MLPLLALLLALAACPPPSRAQSVEDGFSVSIDGALHVVLQQRDGRVLLGGAFGNVQGQPCAWLCRLRHDGSLDPDFVPPELDAPVLALAERGDGRLLVAGHFTTAGGLDRGGVVRLHANGEVDASFADAAADGVVRTLALQADGRVLLAGDFGSVGGSPRSGVARLHANGALDASFADPAVDGPVHAIALQPDGRVVLGGAFDTVQGAARSRLARLQPDGSLDAGFGSATQVIAGQVRALLHRPDGSIVAGGSFTNVAPAAAAKGILQYRGVARFGADGLLDPGFHASLPEMTSINALLALPDGRILAGGFVDNMGLTLGVLYRLGRQGDLDAGYQAGVSLVQSLALQGDGRVLVGGPLPFFVPGGWLLRLHPGGTTDATLPDLAADDQVSALALEADGSLLVGGWFDQIGGAARRRLARVLPGGGVDPGFVPDPGGNVYAIAVHGNAIVVGGAFTSIAGVERRCLAMLQSDGTPFPTFDPQFNGAVMALTRDHSGRWLAGGVFLHVDGLQRRRAVRLLADGTVDPDFMDPAFDGQVTVLAVQHDGTILAGGNFQSVAGVARRGVARLQPDGSLDASFDAGLDGPAQHLLLQPDGRILLAGSFGSVAGVPRPGLARLHPDGSLDTSFAPPAIEFDPGALALQADGGVIVGGGEFAIGDDRYRGVARLLPDGRLDPAFRTADASAVRTMLLQEDGKLVLGGNFTSVNGKPRHRLARLSATGAAWSVLDTDPAADAVVWRRGGTAPELARRPLLAWIDGLDLEVLGPMQRVAGGWRLQGIPMPRAAATAMLQASAPIAANDGYSPVSARREFANDRLFFDGFE